MSICYISEALGTVASEGRAGLSHRMNIGRTLQGSYTAHSNDAGM